MIYTIDTTEIGGIVGVVVTIILALYQACKSQGITWDLVKTKLLVRSDAARLIKHQDDDVVVQKLGISDELVQFLQEIASNPDGTINEEAAMERLKACIAWQNIIIQNNQNKKLKTLEMRKQ